MPLFPGLCLSTQFLTIFFSEVPQPELSYQQFNFTSANDEQTTQKQDLSSNIFYQQLPTIQSQHSNTFNQNQQLQNTPNGHLNTYRQNLQHPNFQNQQHPSMQNSQHLNTFKQNLHHSKTQNQQTSGFIYKNHKFQLANRRKKFINWQCANYRKTQCPAVFYTTLNFEPLFQKHPHISACEPVSPLDRTHSQQMFEGVKSFAGSQSVFEDNFEHVTDSQTLTRGESATEHLDTSGDDG